MHRSEEVLKSYLLLKRKESDFKVPFYSVTPARRRTSQVPSKLQEGSRLPSTPAHSPGLGNSSSSLPCSQAGGLGLSCLAVGRHRIRIGGLDFPHLPQFTLTTSTHSQLSLTSGPSRNGPTFHWGDQARVKAALAEQKEPVVGTTAALPAMECIFRLKQQSSSFGSWQKKQYRSFQRGVSFLQLTAYSVLQALCSHSVALR